VDLVLTGHTHTYGRFRVTRRDVGGWNVTQEEAMTNEEIDQCGLFTVEADGGVTLSMVYLGRRSEETPVRLLWGLREGKPDSFGLERKK
jgi:hypothetical protein